MLFRFECLGLSALLVGLHVLVCGISDTTANQNDGVEADAHAGLVGLVVAVRGGSVAGGDGVAGLLAMC